MADDVLLNPGSGGDTVAADEIAGVKHQRVKLTVGADGVNDGDVAATNPLPVEIGNGTITAAMETDNDAVPGSQIGLVSIGLNYGWDGADWARLGTSGDKLLVEASHSSEEADDGTIAGAQNKPVNVALPYHWDGSQWVRVVDGPLDDGTVSGGNNKFGGLAFSYGWNGANWTRLLVQVDDDSIAGSLSPQFVVAGNYLWNGATWERAVSDTDDDAIAAGLNAPRAIALSYAFDGVDWGRIRMRGGAGLLVEGAAANDAPLVAAPLAIGGRADTTEPVAVDDGDAVNAWMTSQGAIVVAGFDDTNPWPMKVSSSGAVATQLLVGQEPSDDPVSSHPITIGGRASAVEPTAVSADGDVVNLWLDRIGRVVTVAGHPQPELPITIEATSAGDTNVISAPGASVSLYIKRVVLSNEAAAVNPVFLQENGSAVNRGGAALAADGGGTILDYGEGGWKLTANTALEVNLENAGSVWVSVLEYYIAG